jgi:hypothetical protein
VAPGGAVSLLELRDDVIDARLLAREAQGLDQDRGRLSIARHQVSGEEVVRLDLPAEGGKVGVVLRRALEQVLHHQRVVVACARVAGVDQAGDLAQVGDLLLERAVQRLEPLEEREVVDVVRLDQDHDLLLAAELVPELVVGGEDRIVLVEQAFRRGVDLELRQLRHGCADGDESEYQGLDRVGADGLGRSSEPLLDHENDVSPRHGATIDGHTRREV